MSDRRRLVAIGGLVASLGAVSLAVPASASSHREAPLISQDPVADNTDVYAFRDPTDPTKVNVIANYIGLEQPAAGPNFNRFGDDVLYEIKVDNDGDVVEDVTFQFRFRTVIQNPNTFLYNTGRLDSPTDPDFNVRQLYSVRRIDDSGSTLIATDLNTPPVNVGDRSTGIPDNPDGTPESDDARYEQVLAAPTIADLPGGGKVFAGQRDDPFFVDLGSAFDLLGLRPLNQAHVIPLANEPGRDGLAGKNVHTIALQLPIAQLAKSGGNPSTVNDKDSVIGVYASSSRQRVKVLSPAGGVPRTAGRWVQVSRLGLPLVNEVLIPLGLKDKWNASDPADDAQFFGPILDPEPAKLIPVLYPGVTTPQGGFDENGAPRRTDIVAILRGAGTGLSGDQLLPPADLLRLNLAVTPTAEPNRLGILAGDGGGFPNGRRLGDDTVDILLRLLAGGTPFTPEFNKAPNNALTDGVDGNDRGFLGTFPYVSSPRGGYDQPASG